MIAEDVRKICKVINFAVLNYMKKVEKYLDLAREMKMLWKTKVE